MKKYAICLLAAAIAITASAFTTPKKVKPKAGTYIWYDFNGSLIQQLDPSYYSPDSNQIPDCATMLGLCYCEIKALPSQEEDNQPDLQTIIAIRYKPLF